MADITITIPVAQEDRVRAAMAERLNKDLGDVTIADVKAEMINLIVSIVKNYERRAAEDAISIVEVTPT